MDCIIVDLDGTLSDCSHRLHLISQDKKQWNLFFEGCIDDNLIEPLNEILNVLNKIYKVVIITARPENNRELTTQWLLENNIKFDALYMRKKNDYRKSPFVKQSLLDEVRNKYNPIYAFEDRQDCVEMFQNNNIFTFKVGNEIMA